ncbi:MAG: divergent polysaccharide deacetylase family protein [Reyranella sp.]|nr:divergent polysaccharide deacetylase family protein [Reyranella sp.]MBL6651949.1 divergent polysaccharide deacetylase family protein [Reyranella sp.]
MASRKNRSRKANRRSPPSPPGLGERLRQRFEGLIAWCAARRWYAIAAGLLLLFGVSLVGGYWLAERLELGDGERLARDTLEEMKRGGSVTPGEPAPKYARIEDLPGLPQYTEIEPGQPRPTLEEKPRPRPQQVALAPGVETWRKNAVPFRDLSSKPLVAVVIDDVGLDRPRSRRAWELPGPLTMSFLPYAKDLREQAKAARARGHELMLHLPMEPNGRNDPGPNALLVSLSDAELRQRANAALDSFEGFAGVNNHMGSRFTAFKPGMETVLRQFKSRGLMFLDSRTTAQSVGDQLAQEMGVPSIVRHVFLDDDESLDAVRRRLAEAEAVARRQGFVVVIGHPHEATLQALNEWLPTVQGKGMALAPATAVLRKRNGWD